MSQAEIENELRKHGSGFTGGKQRIMALYQTQPDRKLRAKALAKEYGIGGHSHDYLDGSRGFVNHDWKGLEFVHYPDHQKITLKWAQVEKYIDLMIQSDRYLTDEEKEQRATRQEASNYNVGDAAARSSTLNAHYTSPTVIRGIYDAVERMGFRSGNILEPSMGVGNFFGMLPDTMAGTPCLPTKLALARVLRWRLRQWNPSVWVCVRKVCSWFPTI